MDIKKIEFHTIVNAALYLLNKDKNGIGKHKLSKMMYFAERSHMAKYGHRLTQDSFIAMQYGPVPSKLYDYIQYQNVAELELNGNSVRSKVDANLDYLSEAALECLDEAFEYCQNKSFSELTNLSHDDAWEDTLANCKMSPSEIAKAAGASKKVYQQINEDEHLRRMFL